MIHKISHGYVEQIFNERGQFLIQSFVAGDSYCEDDDGNIRDDEMSQSVYFPYDMVQLTDLM